MRFGVHCRLWTTGWTNADLHLQVPAITPIWRQLFASPDQLARDGLKFLLEHSTRNLPENDTPGARSPDCLV